MNYWPPRYRWGLVCVCINIYAVRWIIKHLQCVCVRAPLDILHVCLCIRAQGEPAFLCRLSDITAQQCMTGGKATSSGGMWVILPTLLAPLFIPSAPRVRLLFHRWRRCTAVLLSLSSSLFLAFFPFCTIVLLHAGSAWMILVLWITLLLPFEFYDSRSWQWFSLWRGTLELSSTLYTLWRSFCFRDPALYLTHTGKHESWAPAASREKIVLNWRGSVCLVNHHPKKNKKMLFRGVSWSNHTCKHKSLEDRGVNVS